MADSEQVETSKSCSGVSLAAAAPSEASGLKPAPMKIKIKKSKAHRTPIPGDASGVRSCSMCKRSVPSEWPHRTCERCLERSRRSRERKRLLTMLEKALDADVEPVTCTICTHTIPDPPNQGQGQPRRQQFVLCSSCQGKMISANTPARSRVGRSTLVPGALGVPPAIHIVADGPDVDASTLAGAVPAAAGGVLATNSGVISPVASTSTLAPQPNRPGLVQGWSFDVERMIERLSNTPHMNSKGEYINPQFLPRASSKADVGNEITMDIIFEPSSTVHLPPSLLMRRPPPLHTSAISPVDVTPHPPVPLASAAGPSRRSRGPGIKKPPTIRIPPRPSYFHPSSQLATPASASTVFTPSVTTSASYPLPSPSQPIASSVSSDSAFSRLYSNPSTAAPGRVRLCATRGCNAVLSKTHKWISCNRCLKRGTTEHREEETDGESTLVGDVEKGKEKDRHELTEHTSYKGKERASDTEKEQLHPTERCEERHMSEPTSGETKAIPPITIRRASEPAAMADRSVSSGVIRLPPLRDAHVFAQCRRSSSATPRTAPETTHNGAKANGGTSGGLPTPPPSATTTSVTVSGLGAEVDDIPPPTPMSASFATVHLNDTIMRPPSPVSPAQEKHKGSAYNSILNMQMDVDSDGNTPLASDSDGDLSDLTPLTESDDDDDDDDSSEDEVDALDLVRKRVAEAQQDTSPAGIHDSAVPKKRPPPNPKLSYVCRGNKCQNLIPPRSRWKTCQPCRKRFREYCRQRTDKQPKWMKQDLADDEGKDDQDEVFISPDGHRKCTIRSCYNIIPPVEQYRWKMCESCRTRTRRGARKRRYGVDNISGDERDPSSHDIRFKKLKLLFKGVHVASVEAAEHGETPATETERFTVYQTFEELLHVFRNRFSGFVTAQAQYLRFKLAQADIHRRRPPSDPPSASGGDLTKESGSDPGTSVEPSAVNEVQKSLPVINLDTKPMHFSFEGECSVVADPAGGEVASRIQLVQASVADLLNVDFSVRPPQYRVDEDQRIIGLFGCVCDVLVPLPAPRSGAAAATSDMEAGGTGQEAAVKVQEKRPGSGVADDQAAGQQDAMQVDDDAGEGSADGKDKEQASMDKDPNEKSGYQEKDKHIGSGSRNDMAVKRMSGELEVSVTWDRTHRFLPGLRTVVCFRMVG